MATRIYCDNCGNTVREPNKFCFGPLSHLYAGSSGGAGGSGASPNGGAGGLFGAGGGFGASQQTSRPTTPMHVIDLCDTCQNVWMERVKKLTSASETLD